MKKTRKQDPLYQSWKHIQQSLSTWNMKDAERARRLESDCEWTTWQSFRDDVMAKLGPKPKGKRLARIDMFKGWSLDNLSYVKHKTMSQRQISTHRVRYKGKTYCAKEFAKLAGVSYWTMLSRLRKGQTAEEALRGPHATR